MTLSEPKRGAARLPDLRDHFGFTILELLIVVALSSIVLTGIYSVFRAQQRAHATNTQVVEMQQNLRTALAIMERDIRMAGYRPSGIVTAGFVQARPGLMEVTIDCNDDGSISGSSTGCEEDVIYGFPAADDANRDGQLAPGQTASLGRDWGSGIQPMATNIERIYFSYAFDSNLDGDLDTSGGNVIWAVDSTGTGTLNLNADTGAALGATVPLNRIRAVRVQILARSRTGIQGYKDTRTYTLGPVTYNPSGTEENFMRKLLETTVKCRNMGM